MKKIISILLSAAMLFGVISSSGAFTAVAVEENPVEDNTVEETRQLLASLVGNNNPQNIIFSIINFIY